LTVDGLNNTDATGNDMIDFLREIAMESVAVDRDLNPAVVTELSPIPRSKTDVCKTN
jgi:hypothetical protein